MGQYLAIGLVMEINFMKAEMKKYKLSPDDILTEMENSHNFKPEIYILKEEINNYKLELNQDVFEKELISFLEDFYPKLYLNNIDSNYRKILEELKNNPADEWINIAKRKSFSEFQYDDCSERQIIHFKKPFLPKIYLYSNEIMLSFEGKIVMECNSNQFNFFRNCMISTFSKYKLANALRVYITG